MQTTISFSSVIKEEKQCKVQNPTFHISNITGDQHSYSYPSQNITVTKLSSNNTYSLCVHAYNLTTTELLGDEVCLNFATTPHHSNKGIMYSVRHFYVYLALNK